MSKVLLLIPLNHLIVYKKDNFRHKTRADMPKNQVANIFWPNKNNKSKLFAPETFQISIMDEPIKYLAL